MGRAAAGLGLAAAFFALFGTLAFWQHTAVPPTGRPQGFVEEPTEGSPGRGPPAHNVSLQPWWPPASLTRRVPLPATKYVTWATNKYCGFNNQRQALTAALVVAHALNRTLLLRRYLPTFHDRRAAVDIGAYFDTDALQGCVPVARVEEVEAAGRPLTRLPMQHHDPLEAVPLSLLRDRYRQSPADVLYLPFPWVHLPLFFALDPAEAAEYDALQRRCLRFQPGILRWAARLRRALPARYHAIHYRLQDYQATPLVDCPAVRGAEDFTRDNLTCVTAVGTHVYTMQDAVAADAEVRVGDTVFVATNQRSDGQVARFEQYAARRGLKLRFFADLCQATAGCEAWRSQAPSLHLSAVEQVLAVYSHLFFATFPSTWDEWVLTARRWLGAPRAATQDALFIAKLRQRKEQCRRRPPRPGRAKRLHGWDVRWNFCPL